MINRLPILLTISLISCLDSPKTETPAFKKVERISQLSGYWSGGGDTLKIFPWNMTLQFNDGPVQRMTYENDGHFFFINAYIGNTETFAASIQIKKEYGRTYLKVDRIDGGADFIYSR